MRIFAIRAVGMKIVLSRKGFDSSSGGGPSPIVDGRCLSLPIPEVRGVWAPTYSNRHMGGHVMRASKGRVKGWHRMHNDPMFAREEGWAALGQYGAAQTHLERQGVGVGDLFLFFGLFCKDGDEPHHRIFGYMVVSEVIDLATCDDATREWFAFYRHPHALGMHGGNDTIWFGRGVTGAPAHDDLRLTVPDGPPSLWQVPAWLRETGLSYHSKADRWLPEDRLQSVARGQEFVADAGERDDARRWAAQIIAAIES